MSKSYKNLQVLLLVVLMLFTTNGIFAQKSLSPDARLTEWFGEEKLDGMMNIAPHKVAHYNCFLNESFYVSSQLPQNYVMRGDVGNVKHSRDKNLLFNEEESLLNGAEINRLKYEFRAEPDKHAVYSIGSSGKYLIFYPENIYQEKESAYLKKHGINY